MWNSLVRSNIAVNDDCKFMVSPADIADMNADFEESNAAELEEASNKWRFSEHNKGSIRESNKIR